MGSYENEAKFYESPLPDRICDSGASCPRPLFVDRQVTGVDAGALTICMKTLWRRVQKKQGGDEGCSGVARAAPFAVLGKGEGGGGVGFWCLRARLFLVFGQAGC